MSKQCDICGKKSIKANKVCFSNKRHTYRQEPNLQSVKVKLNGTVKRLRACTSCIKADKVQKAI